MIEGEGVLGHLLIQIDVASDAWHRVDYGTLEIEQIMMKVL